jgi:hypothetical protein
MNRRGTLIIVGLLTWLGAACTGRTGQEQHKQANQKENVNPMSISYHCVYAGDSSKNCKCPIQLDLKDSSKLTLIKGRFYKSATGHLYEKNWSQQQLAGQDTLTEVLYFNGYFSQEVDPLTFQPLEGWYAKDKRHVYYYRPVSGGTQISKIDTADTRTFQLLAGHYRYARDKNFFYDEVEIIEGFIPAKTHLQMDDKGQVIEMTCENKVYKFASLAGNAAGKK